VQLPERQEGGLRANGAVEHIAQRSVGGSACEWA